MKISVNTNGGPGRPAGALNSQMRIRIEKVARMRVNGTKDARIKELLDINDAAFNYLIKLPEFIEVQEEILQGHLTALDRATAGQVDVLRQEMRNAVPVAMRTILEAAAQRRDLRTALAASVEILDRDPDRVAQKNVVKSGDGSQGPVFRVPQGVIDITTDDTDSIISELKKAPEQQTVTT